MNGFLQIFFLLGVRLLAASQLARLYAQLLVPVHVLLLHANISMASFAPRSLCGNKYVEILTTFQKFCIAAYLFLTLSSFLQHTVSPIINLLETKKYIKPSEETL